LLEINEIVENIVVLKRYIPENVLIFYVRIQGNKSRLQGSELVNICQGL
jgi:hypothetical protein